jgi:hypothetical protein
MYVVFLVLASVFGCDAPVADGAGNGAACDAGSTNGNGGGSTGQWLCSGIAIFPGAGTATCQFRDGRNMPIVAINTDGQPVTEWDLDMLRAAAEKYGWVFAVGACSVWCDQPMQECSDKTHARELPVCANNTCQVDGVCPSQQSDAGVPQSDAAVKRTDGESCDNAAKCQSGYCVDGVCCNSACNGLCAACNVAGSVGKCENIPAGQDPANECGGTDVCNGMGGCTAVTTGLTNGAACSISSQCSSGFCVDGVCCNSACNGLCQVCNLTGNLGSCAYIAANSDPSDECAGTGTCGGTCNGAGACQFPSLGLACVVPNDGAGTCNGLGTCVPNTLLGNGLACTSASQCQSGYCVDGVCCNSTCGGLCQACNLAGSVGACANIPNSQDPANECAGAFTCNGAGGCTTSTSCTADAQCNDNSPCTVDACVSGLCANTPKTCGSGLVCDPVNGNCVLPSAVTCYGLTVTDPGPDATNCVWWAKGSGNAISSYSPHDNQSVVAPALACAVTCYKGDGVDTAPQMCAGKWKDGHQQDWSAAGGLLPVSGMGCTWDGKLR